MLIIGDLTTSIPGTVNADTYPGGLAAAIATGSNVVFSKDFDLGSTLVTLSDNQKIISYGGTISFSGTVCMQVASNNTLESLVFSGNPQTFALNMPGTAKNLTVRDARCTDCSLFASNKGVLYASIDWDGKTNVPSNATFINCVGEYTNATQSTGTFIIAQFIDGVTISGGRASGYKYAFYYWGGDSDTTSGQGAVGNTRKCDNIFVYNFVSDNCWQAGLWGSMGALVEFNGCSAYRDTIGGDVGFDHEGTLTAKTIGCYARNFQNGNYASFFYGGTHDITGCSSEQPGGYPHYRNYNSALLPENTYKVSITGCMFKRSASDTSDTLCSIDSGNGPWNKLLLHNNYLENCRVTNTTTNCGDCRITDNSFVITSTPAAAIQLIRVHANYDKNLGDIDVAGNSLRLNDGVSWVSGSSFIYAVTSGYNQRRTVRIRDNRGPGSIALFEQGGNTGISGLYFVYDNVVTGVTKSNSGALDMVLARSDNNYTNAGALITVS